MEVYDKHGSARKLCIQIKLSESHISVFKEFLTISLNHEAIMNPRLENLSKLRTYINHKAFLKP